MSRWVHAEPTLGRVVAGLDLDGRGGDARTDRCDDALDYRSRDGRPGIDNQYAANLLGLLDGDAVTAAVDAELAAGRRLVGIRLLPGEAEVPRAELLSFEATGALPRPVPEMVARGELRVTSATPLSVRWRGNHLSLVVPRIELPMGAELGAHPVLDADIDVVIRPDGSAGHAELAGAVEIATVLAVAEIRAPGIDEGTIRGVSQPDLLPNDDGSRCERVSLGLELELLRLP